MFILYDTALQLTRNKGRSLLLLLAAAMLAGCMAFYLGNIRANQEAIDDLSSSTRVEAWISSNDGSNTSFLNIDPIRAENFTASPYLKDFRLCSVAATALGEEGLNQDPFRGGDASVIGSNGLEARWAPDASYTFAQGYGPEDMKTDKPLCVMYEGTANFYDIELGDQVTIPIYLRRSRDVDEYVYIGDHTLSVIGLDAGAINPATFLVSTDWLRKVTEEAGVGFTYSYCGGVLKSPKELNRFKASIADMVFLPLNPAAEDKYSGISVIVEDEAYITTAEELGQTILVFSRFLGPFFVLVVGLVMLAIFLILRGSRRDMAIAISLGRPKLLTALSSFLSVFIAEILGCGCALPVMVLGAGLSLEVGLAVCGAFMLCAVVGDVLGLLLLLRFDVLSLLIAPE